MARIPATEEIFRIVFIFDFSIFLINNCDKKNEDFKITLLVWSQFLKSSSNKLFLPPALALLIKISIWVNSSDNSFINFSNLSNLFKSNNLYEHLILKESNFSYFSFERISQLYEKNNIQVNLSWKEDVLKKTKLFAQKFIKPTVTVHLKYIYPYNISDSNADVNEWSTFFKNNNEFDFILIGDDKLPDEITSLSNVHYANQLTLSCQLCLVSSSIAFLGTASGVCNAAFFSQTPFVVFKHPLHHINEMQNELGNNNKFNFSSNKQLLLRELATHQTIQEAFNLLL